MPIAGLFDALWRGVSDAMNDARQRVVEEGWFGRPMTDNRTDNRTPDVTPPGWDRKPADFDTQWAVRAPEAKGPEPDHDIHGQDMER